MPSWALLVCRLGAIHMVRATMTTRSATPVALHLNFFARTITTSTKNPFRPPGSASERRGEGHVTLGYANDRERTVDWCQDFVVLVERRVSDIYHIASLQRELLRHKDRYGLEEVQPKNTRPRCGIVLQIPHSEHLNARFVCPLIAQLADIAQRLQQAEIGLRHFDVALFQHRPENGVEARIGPDNYLIALLYRNVSARQQVGKLRGQDHLTLASNHYFGLV